MNQGKNQGLLAELKLLVDAVQPALGRALLAHPGVGAPQGEGVELLQAVRAEGLGYPLDLVGLPVPRERAPELVLALLVEAHRVFPDGDVARPHRRGVHDLGAVLHQRLGRLRLGAVHGAAGPSATLMRHVFFLPVFSTDPMPDNELLPDIAYSFPSVRMGKKAPPKTGRVKRRLLTPLPVFGYST